MSEIQIQNPAESDKLSEITDKFDKTLILQSSSSSSRQINDEEQLEAENGDEALTRQSSTSTTDQIDEDEENEEFEFCFFGEAVKSPVSAEEVFEDGQIRIISPFAGEVSDSGEGESSHGPPPVKKMFVVSSSPDNDDVEEGSYCVWETPTPEMSKKSNSTGFSKLWKVRDLLARSNSDGKDAFVFLKNGDDTTSLKKEKKNKVKLEKIDVGKKGETTTYEKKENSSKKKKKSAYEVFYGDSKKKGGGGKSYLPYRQDLVGFFTNGSGMSRNIHPY
ncbi:Serine/threonine-protein kinase TEL1 [Bienertia sinuspersici]